MEGGQQGHILQKNKIGLASDLTSLGQDAGRQAVLSKVGGGDALEPFILLLPERAIGL